MRNVIVTVFGFFLFLIVMSGVFAERAQAGVIGFACSVAIGKETNAGGPIFNFLVERSGGDTFEIPVGPGDENGFRLQFGESAIVTELVPDGWRLVDVQCESGPGVAISIGEDNNVLVNCLAIGEGSCTFTNWNTGAIPTLSEWGMIAAVAGLGFVGVFFAVRRRKAKAV